jgi:hypothetical protein
VNSGAGVVKFGMSDCPRRVWVENCLILRRFLKENQIDFARKPEIVIFVRSLI